MKPIILLKFVFATLVVLATFIAYTNRHRLTSIQEEFITQNSGNEHDVIANTSLTIPSTRERQIEINDMNIDLIDFAAEHGPDEVIFYIQGLEADERKSKFYLFSMRYVKIDPEFIARNFNSMELNKITRTIVLREIMDNWRPSKIALEWANDNLTDDMKQTAFTRIMDSLFHEEKDFAIEFANSLSPGRLRDSVINALHKSWASFDYESLLEELPYFDSERDRMNAISSLAPHWVSNDFESIDSYLGDERIDAGIRRSIAGEVSLSISYSDPAQALDWLSMQTVMDSKVVVDARILNNWLANDLQETLEYIENSEDMERRLTFAIEYSKANPLSAANWIHENSENRSDSLELYSILFGWSLIDPVSAHNWVSNLDANGNNRLYREFVENLANRKLDDLSVVQIEAIERFGLQGGILPPQIPGIR